MVYHGLNDSVEKRTTMNDSFPAPFGARLIHEMNPTTALVQMLKDPALWVEDGRSGSKGGLN